MITIKDLGGRKFILCVLILTFTFLLILTNRVSSPDYLKVAFGVITLYTGSNVYQKLKVPIEKVNILK